MAKRDRIKKLKRAFGSEDPAFRESQERLIARQKEEFPDEKTIILRSPPGHEKMSEVLEKFAAPWLDGLEGEEDVRKILYLAALGWNLGLASPEERFKALSETPVYAQIPVEMRLFLEELISRKENVFPTNHRFIMDLEIDFNENGKRYLQVMSTIDPTKVQGLLPRGIGPEPT